MANMSVTPTQAQNGTALSLDSSKHDLPLATEIIIGILFLVGFPSGLLGNLLVILAVLFTRLRQRVSNILILNLAITDFLVSALPMPLYGIYYVFYWPQWDFGRPLCKAALYIMRVCGTMSVLTLVVIAIDRYVAVIRNKKLLRRKGILILLGVMWGICLIAMVYPLLGDGLESVDLGGKHFDVCQKMSGEPIKEKAFFATLLLQTVISVLIIACLLGVYVSMISTIWKAKDMSGASDSAVQGKRQNARAVKMMFGILIAFFVSWVPYWVVTFFRLYPIDEEKGIDPSIVLFFYSLAILNSAWNPILYALISRAFRAAYKQVVTGQLGQSHHSSVYHEGTRATRLQTRKGSSPQVIRNINVKENGH